MGVFANLFLSHDELAAMIADDRIAAVTLTGSEGAGQRVGAMAGANLRSACSSSEDSDAFIIGSSADLEVTIPKAVTARVQNNGQSCIAAKRFIVVKDRAEEFINAFTDAMSKVIVGDPMDPSTVLGPLVNKEQRDLIDEQVQDSVAKGAVVRTGGKKIEGNGYYYPATVLTNVPRDSRAGSKSSSVRSPSSKSSRIWMRRSPSPTRRRGALVVPSGQPIKQRSTRPSPASNRGWSSPTPSSPRRPNFPLAASRSRATGASSQPSESGSS